ncbi:hypothetical protein PssvBMR6_gp01 [Pseudomonas phage MR6]|nr:hypothetical protein PssvBMR6_gp01 [Pseudomonas phage MR6]QJD54888.1 hypothetical protein PssvBMR7_gp01 [Pseudomonas phage MR7]
MPLCFSLCCALWQGPQSLDTSITNWSFTPSLLSYLCHITKTIEIEPSVLASLAMVQRLALFVAERC